MLYKHLVVFIVFILLMFSIHYVKPKPPVREGFLDVIETELRKSKVGSAIADVGVDIKVFKRKSKPKPAGAPTFRWWWSQPNANGWGKKMSGVDVVSKDYYDKQVKKKEEFYNEHRWVCLPGSEVPVRIHPYNKYILEQHPSSMEGNRDQKTKICRGLSPMVYDKNAQHGDPNKRPPNTGYKVNWSSLFRSIGDLNDDYDEEPVANDNKGGGSHRLNEHYNSSSNRGEININGRKWDYYYDYSDENNRNNRLDATQVVLESGNYSKRLPIPDTVRKLNDTYNVYCANHIPEDSFYYTEYGIASSDEWPDDAMLTDFNCNTGPWSPKIRKTDIFKKSKYVNNRNGKPIHKNVERYNNSSNPRDRLVLECEESYRKSKPDNCRNPALWERRCKAVKNLCENALPLVLENAEKQRQRSELCKEFPGSAACFITHPSCDISESGEQLYCNTLLNKYDETNKKETSYWSKGIYDSLKNNATSPEISAEERKRSGGGARAGRGRDYSNRRVKDDYFNKREIYGKFIDFAEIPVTSGTLR